MWYLTSVFYYVDIVSELGKQTHWMSFENFSVLFLIKLQEYFRFLHKWKICLIFAFFISNLHPCFYASCFLHKIRHLCDLLIWSKGISRCENLSSTDIHVDPLSWRDVVTSAQEISAIFLVSLQHNYNTLYRTDLHWQTPVHSLFLYISASMHWLFFDVLNEVSRFLYNLSLPSNDNCNALLK